MGLSYVLLIMGLFMYEVPYTIWVFFMYQASYMLASFPGSPLAPTKNRKGGGEPGIDSHVISQHDAFALTIR